MVKGPALFIENLSCANHDSRFVDHGSAQHRPGEESRFFIKSRIES